MKNSTKRLAVLLLWTLCLLTSGFAQITPLGDSYTNSADPTTNYGAKTLLDVDAATQITYIQFNLSSIPTGASISQATLKLYVNAVTTAGAFEVYAVNGTWSESTITYELAPALGIVIDSNVPITTADKNQYILIPMTSTVQGWVNTPSSNNGIALVAVGKFNATFDSKESTSTSHPAELDIVFAGDGTITGVTTSSGSGLTGGGTSGTLNLSLLNTCGNGQVLVWSGSAWACATSSGSTALSSITSPTANTSIVTGTFPTTFTEGDFGSSPVPSAFGITDTATSTTDDSFDLTVENGNNSFHNPFSTGVTTGGTYYPQLQICNNGSGHVGASLFGNSITCGTLSNAPFNKVTITDNTGSHTGLAVLNNASAETGTMLRLLSATPTSGSYNFLTACAGTTAADELCKGTIVATLTAPGAFSVATSVTAPQFCIGSSCITSWPSGGTSANVTRNPDTNNIPQLAAANTFTGNQTVNGNLAATGLVTGAKVGIGTSALSDVFTIANGAGPAIADGWTTYSSQRWKTNIHPLHDALGVVEQLRGVSFDVKETGKREIGVIAEEVGKVVPEVVSYEENGKDTRGVDYGRLTALLIEATKQQHAEFRQQPAELTEALRQIKRQQSLLRAQTSAMRSLEAEVRGARETLRKVKAQVNASQLAVVAAK